MKRNFIFRAVILSAVICAVIVLFCGCTPGESREAGGRFYFVQITDTHFGKYDHYERARWAVESINDLPVDAVCAVVTGDMLSDNIYDSQVVEKGKAILDELDCPVHYVAGNHDIIDDDFERSSELYQRYYGPVFDQAEYEGVVFLFVYTEPLSKGFEGPFVDVFGQVRRGLDDAGDKPVIIFHHRPSSRDFYHNKFHETWSEQNRREWVDIINSGNVKAVITGHYHRDELFWAGDVPVFVSAPIAGFWSRQSVYRIYEYDNGKVGYRTRYKE